MMNFSFDDFKAMRDFLTDVCDVNDEVIECMCLIHGYTLETLDDVCYWKFGMTCEQKKKKNLRRNFNMKIVVRGISKETTKDEIKAIIRAFCKCESVYAKADLSNKGNLKGVKVYYCVAFVLSVKEPTSI